MRRTSVSTLTQWPLGLTKCSFNCFCFLFGVNSAEPGDRSDLRHSN